MNKIVAATAILIRDRKILITQRPNFKSYPGLWEFPGGKLEANETSECALVRELKEELGIHILQPQYLFEYEYRYPDRHVHLFVFQVTEWVGEIQSCEQQAFAWVTDLELMQYELLAGARGIFKKIHKNLSI